MTAGLLIVEDDDVIGFAMTDYFGRLGYRVAVARTCAEARSAVAAGDFDLAVIDNGLPDGDGVELVRALIATSPHLGIVMVTGLGTIDLVVRAIREGARNFLTKPVELPALAVILARVLEERRNERVAATARSRRATALPNPALALPAAIREVGQRAAEVPVAVLILGDTGTGKGYLARWLHSNGPRRNEALVELNCAGLSRELVESELFGHDRGAFTGADSSKPGLLELAHNGTLFLDEVAELDLVVQAKLLKVLEDQRFRRVGGTQDRRVSVRVVSATSRDLEAMVARGEFRRDLYFRLAGVVIDMPALRDRRDEVPRLVDDVLRDLGLHPTHRFSDEAVAVLVSHDWPGNVRELRNVVERVCLFTRQPVIEASELTPHLRPLRRSAGVMAAVAPPESHGRLTLAELERRHIAATLDQVDGRVEVAAEWLGIPRSTLYERLRRYGLTRRG